MLEGVVVRLEPLRDQPFGARLVDLDPVRADPAVLQSALAEHRVLVVEDLPLTPAAFAAFGSKFGSLVRHHLGELCHPDDERVLLLTNREPDQTFLGGRVARGTSYWHVDGAYLEQPYKATMLHALESPVQGGSTRWGDMYTAWAELPAVLQDQYSQYRVLNRLGAGPRRAGQVATSEGVEGSFVHPLRSVHPTTGMPWLFVSEAHLEGIIGLGTGEAEDTFIDDLIAHAHQTQFQTAYKLDAGSSVIWDNRSLIHRGPSDFDEPRTLLRLLIRE